MIEKTYAEKNKFRVHFTRCYAIMQLFIIVTDNYSQTINRAKAKHKFLGFADADIHQA